ncbi:MAG: gamma-glutamyltransferase family protein [Alphaproteobacteria bacterium]|nr:gamma-glutamyltransferase family protein [Alphaproteobacteria bacterium]
MSRFTTRPVIRGTHGMVAATHYLGALAGWEILQRGGNAVDAACAAGFVLQVAEPHLCGPAGEVPILIHSARDRRVVAIAGQGGAPGTATIAHFDALGLDVIPGTGLLAATVPAAFDAWATALGRYGTMTLADVLEPAVALAEKGCPLLPGAAAAIEAMAPYFRDAWPSSAALWLRDPALRRPGAPFRNPELAATWRRILNVEWQSAPHGRERAIEAARDAFYKGFVAEAIDRFVRAEALPDSSGRRHRGLLGADDLAAHVTAVEEPPSVDHAGLRVFKCGPWSQGPVFLQQLRLLAGFDLAAMGFNSADYLHTVIETAKLAYADREAWYGDPAFADVPLATLLSEDYAAARRTLVDANAASQALRPGAPDGRLPDLAFLARAEAHGDTGFADAGGVGEPTATRARPRWGDTVHIDVVDKDGNMVAATPSGGWLQSSPAVPGLGFPLGTRAQMFWLVDGHPNALAPRKRPRTTLTPTLVTRDGAPHLAFGSPGGDCQDQWTLHFFLAHVHFGLDLQAAIEAPEWQSIHWPDSFYPRGYTPAGVLFESRMDRGVLETLARRGHRIGVLGPWDAGHQLAVGYDAESRQMTGAASPRAEAAYVVGR